MLGANLQGIRRRLAAAVSANIVGKLWVVLGQLLSVPILTARWGVDGYGVWLMLTTIPTYVALSGAGFGTAAMVDMIRSLAGSDQVAALRTFQSTWTLLCGAGAFVAVVVISAFAIGSPDSAWVPAACILALYSVAAINTNVLAVAFRSTGRYAQGTLLLDLIMPVEICATLLVAALEGGWVQAALGLLLVRFLGLLAYYLALRRAEPWIRIGWRYASITEVRRMAPAALGAAGVTIAAALSLQGVLLAIGIFLGPGVAGLFGAARTLARTPLQFAGLAMRATGPELSAALYRGQTSTARKLALVNIACIAAIAAPCSAIIAAKGDQILAFISQDSLIAPRHFFAWLAMAALMTSTWEMLSQFLGAINRYSKIALASLVAAAVSSMIPGLFSDASITHVTAALCVLEFIMVIVVASAAWSEPSLRQLLVGSADRPDAGM